MPSEWRWVGERALLRTFRGDLAAANAAAFAAYRRIVASRHDEIEDVVPGARTLLMILRPGEEPSDALLVEMDHPAMPTQRPFAQVHEIVVSYGGEDGPDLADVASLHGLTAAEVVRIHSSATYVVGFTGFSPGFPYLFGLPAVLATPRLATPRTRVAKGSVGIGGSYTGVYPQATAGGWRIIGRTEAELFDQTREPPVLLTPGTGVRFVAS